MLERDASRSSASASTSATGRKTRHSLREWRASDGGGHCERLAMEARNVRGRSGTRPECRGRKRRRYSGQSAHFCTSLPPQGITGTVDVELFAEPAIGGSE